MKNLLKKASAMMLAFALLLGLMTAPPVHADNALFTIESENAQLTSDLQVTTQIYGHTRRILRKWICLDAEFRHITFTVTVPETA